LAQRWIAIGSERLDAGQADDARRALEQARGLDPQAPGLGEFAERVGKAR
jgi:cytochrome c-type biogenesis protein CcmH/NrfG